MGNRLRRDGGSVRRTESGASLVEFAFALPVLLAILLGIITGGVAFSRSIAVDNAAREAARYGATLPVDGSIDDWLNDVADVAIRSATGDMDDGEQGRQVCVALLDGSETTRITVDTAGDRSITPGLACFVDGRPSDERRVQVELQRESDILLVLWDKTVTLTGESTVRFERGG